MNEVRPGVIRLSAAPDPLGHPHVYDGAHLQSSAGDADAMGDRVGARLPHVEDLRLAPGPRPRSQVRDLASPFRVEDRPVRDRLTLSPLPGARPADRPSRARDAGLVQGNEVVLG